MMQKMNSIKVQTEKGTAMKKVIIAAMVLGLAMAWQWCEAPQALAQEQEQAQAEVEAPAGGGWFCPWCGRGDGQGYQEEYDRGYDRGSGRGYGRGYGRDYDSGYDGYGRRGRRHMMGRDYGTWDEYHGRGYGPGPMMGDDWGRWHDGRHGRGMRFWGRGAADERWRTQTPLDQEQAKDLLRGSVSDNPNLTVGDARDKGEYFEVDIVTKDGSLVETMEVHKESGWVRRSR